MEKLTFSFRALIALLLLTGCSQQIGPPKSEIVENYDESLLNNGIYFQVSKFDIEATENLGTKTEPEVHSRYKATLKVNASTIPENIKKIYKERGLHNKDVYEIHGIAISQRSGEDWDTKFEVETKNRLNKELWMGEKN